MITPKQVCDAGFAASMAQARRMIACGAVKISCQSGHACTCIDKCDKCGCGELVLKQKTNKK